MNKKFDISLKLFLLNTFGGIKKTSKIEAEKEALKKDYQVFTKVAQSDELREFQALEEKVNSVPFQKLKSDLSALKFEKSPEETQLKRFNKLKKNKRLRKFYQTAGSSDLKRYEALKEGTQLDRFFELKRIIDQGPKQKSEQTKEIKQEYKALKSSSDVRFFHKYPKSHAFKNYLNMKNSEEMREYEELKEIVESDEFNQRKTYLEDPKKWEKTSEFSIGQRYLELKNRPEIVLYFKYKGTSAFDFLSNWEVVFEDRFEEENFCLESEDNSARISLLEAGAKKQFGISKAVPGKVSAHTCSLSGLSAGRTYIFRLEWQKGKVSWKINDKQLFTVETNVPDEPMHLHLTSLVLRETNGVPHKFEIDWIRFYQKRKQ